MHRFGHQLKSLVIALTRYNLLEVWQIPFRRTFEVICMDLAIAMSSEKLLAHYDCKREVARTKTWSRAGLVTYDSRDAQRDWIECLRLG